MNKYIYDEFIKPETDKAKLAKEAKKKKNPLISDYFKRR